MTDFCKQCSLAMFGKDHGDLAGRTWDGGLSRVRCDGCGPLCLVDHTGTCVSAHCLKEHGPITQGDESARVEQWAANYLDCQTEPNNDTQCSK